MQYFLPIEFPAPLEIPLINFRVAAGFPSPAADYVEARIDLNKELIKHPAFTFFFYTEGDSMAPVIADGSLLIVDRKIAMTEGCVVVASINQEYCVKYFFNYPDGSIELRSENPKYKSIHLSDEFEGEFEIFGVVTWFGQKPPHASRRSD